MSNLLQDLEKRQREGTPISVAVVGAGQMGRGLVASLGSIPGMTPALVVDKEIGLAEECLINAGIARHNIEMASDSESASRLLAQGFHVISKDIRIIPSDGIDAVVEATGIPEVGARVALDTIRRRQHIVMLNVETDVTIGPLLKQMADQAHVVYSVSAGDEPGATVELVEFARTLGFKVIAAGKGKNNELIPDATPDTVRQEAMDKGASPHMFCSFVDGTKTMVEMTAVANATGLVPETPGMRGLQLTVDDLCKTLIPREWGGVLTQIGVVEFVRGVAPGVFVVITSDNDVIRDDLRYLKVGPGPAWTLFRPYHLANLETPHTVAKAVLYGEKCLAPGDRPVAETVGVAKTDLQVGDKIDGIGGYTVRGLIMTAKSAKDQRAVPLGLLENAVLQRPVAQGEIIRQEDVGLSASSLVVSLRHLQDQWLVS